MADLFNTRLPGVSSLLGTSLASGGAVSDLFGTPSMGSLASLLMEGYRQRQEWNERFEHWERRESDSETERIERARDMVRNALSESAWLSAQGTRIVPQGSFTNRTNTRNEADIDLRVQHPMIKVDYAPSVNQLLAYSGAGYSKTGIFFADVIANMRHVIVGQLVGKFGAASVDASGKKAIRVRGLEGSRGEVDVVPTFALHYITGYHNLFGWMKAEGAAILGLDGSWTLNYPDQHAANGIAKRSRTGHQFKKVVRIIKRMRADMEERGILKAKVPSFLVECLVYLVEDHLFTVDGDDRYGRVKRVLTRISEILSNPLYALSRTEINEIKPLFGSGQAWSLDSAKEFTKLAIAHLGNL